MFEDKVFVRIIVIQSWTTFIEGHALFLLYDLVGNTSRSLISEIASEGAQPLLPSACSTF
jgi:hypothetical protein